MKKIVIIGLGYVGLPLAVEFGKIRPTIGFDINLQRVLELKEGFDRTNECSNTDLLSAKNLMFSSIMTVCHLWYHQQDVHKSPRFMIVGILYLFCHFFRVNNILSNLSEFSIFL